MSADNGIYILVTMKKDSHDCEYRVAHAQAIDNLDYGTEEDKQNSMVQYFGKSKVYNESDAILFAHDLAKNYSVLEYGVSTIDLTPQEFPEIPYEQACNYWRHK